MKYYSTAANLKSKHGFFGRAGGFSDGIYNSLNCGVGSDDNPDCVSKNREKVCTELGGERLITLHQTHSNICVVNPTERVEGDAIISTQEGLVIGVLTADCLPLLLEDTQAGVVAAAHAGWKGALGGVVESTVAKMRKLGANNISAAIGHCLLLESFEVQQDFIDLFIKQSVGNELFFHSIDGSIHFSNVDFVLDKLRKLEIHDVSVVAEDTLSQPEKFFSYRYSRKNNHADYGRQISAICL